jgi:hypothetical protein
MWGTSRSIEVTGTGSADQNQFESESSCANIGPMRSLTCLLLPTLSAALLVSTLHAQPSMTKNDLNDSIRSCQIIQFTLAARGEGEDIPKEDDFALAGKGCKRLQTAIAKSDEEAVQSEVARLRTIFSQLGMPPSTPREQLLAAESRAAKLSGEELFDELPDLAKRSFNAEEIDKAGAYAKRLVDMAPSYHKSWNYGNAIFDAHLVLGRIALQHGDISMAGEHLLAAGATPGSPQLDSFGPNMALAKELLEKGQPEVVLKFFVLCKKFWEMDAGKLERWTTEVRGGKIPDFGANLNY